MQVDSIKSCVEGLWLQRLKLQCYEPLSNFACNLNLRRFIQGVAEKDAALKQLLEAGAAMDVQICT